MDELAAIRRLAEPDPLVDERTRSRTRDRLAAHIEAEIRPTRSILLRQRRRGGLVALLAIVAAVALAVAPSRFGSNRHLSLLERAAAAVSTGPVLHAVIEAPATTITAAPASAQMGLINLATGREQPVEWKSEIWFDADRTLLRERQSIGGTVVRESLQTPTQSVDNLGKATKSAGLPQLNRSLATFLGRGYKEALAAGQVTVEGKAVVDGRNVLWLHFPATVSEIAENVAVDSDSYRPLFVRPICPTCTVTPPTYRITTLEGVRTDAADFAPPAATNPHPVASFKAQYSEIATPGAARALGHPALWPGGSVGTLELTGVALVQTSREASSGEHSSSRGLLFFYGGEADGHGSFAAAPGQPYVSVAEAADAGYRFDGFNFDVVADQVRTSAAGAAVPPEGYAAITWFGGWWSLQLRRGGLYVEVDASSRDLALQAARALYPG